MQHEGDSLQLQEVYLPKVRNHKSHWAVEAVEFMARENSNCHTVKSSVFSGQQVALEYKSHRPINCIMKKKINILYKLLQSISYTSAL